MIPLQDQHNLRNLSPNVDVLEIVSESSVSAVNFSISSTQKMNMFSHGTKQVRTLMAMLSKPSRSLNILQPLPPIPDAIVEGTKEKKE